MWEPGFAFEVSVWSCYLTIEECLYILRNAVSGLPRIKYYTVATAFGFLNATSVKRGGKKNDRLVLHGEDALVNELHSSSFGANESVCANLLLLSQFPCRAE